MAKQAPLDEERFNAEVQKQLGDIEEELKSTVRIAIVGKVSTGKSSLLNALFKRSRNNILAKVMATSGVTTECQSFSLGKNIEIIDSPGLGDVIKENSQITLDNLNSIDVGILVVSDSVDVSQKGHYDELSLHCKKVFVVLNKIDLYDKKKKAALEKVVQQWHEVLGLKDDEKIFQTCVDGYDPETDDDVELDIRGVDELRKEIFAFLKEHGKYLVLAREIEEKSTLVKEVIVACMIAVAGCAFIPGSSVYITGAQAAAIIRIHYIYTGEVISKSHVTALIPLFFSWSIGSSAFLAVKSFLPPTGVLDAAAAGVAMGVTFAMLSTVNWMYKNGYNFKDNKGEIKEQFKKFYKTLQDINLSEIWNIVKTRDSVAIMALINKFVKD